MLLVLEYTKYRYLVSYSRSFSRTRIIDEWNHQIRSPSPPADLADFAGQCHTRAAGILRLTSVGKIAFLGAMAVACLSGSNPKLDPLLQSVENRDKRAKKLRVGFVETYKAPPRPRPRESGTF